MKLPADAIEALAALGLVAANVEDLTPLKTSLDRATARVELADGVVVKVRVASRPQVAVRIAALSRRLEGMPISRVLHRRGRVCIEEWVPGESLARLPVTRARLERAADLLGRLHTHERPRRRSVAPLVRRTRRQMATLVVSGVLDVPSARAIVRCLASCAPTSAELGLGHSDLCADNLVEATDGRIFAIDNGGLQVGFLDGDLARTWYRWPLDHAAWRTLAERYGHWRAEPEEPAWRFWRVIAVVRSLAFRHRARARGIDVPLRRLRELISSWNCHSSGTSADGTLSRSSACEDDNPGEVTA